MKYLNNFISSYLQQKKTGLYLFGHNVIENKPINRGIQTLAIELKKLNTIINILKSMGFIFISMEESIDIVFNQNKIKKPWIHLTFDDGFKNNYTLLYPFLKKMNIPFTIFISTRNITESKRFDNYYIACSVFHTSKKEKLNKILHDYKIPNDRISTESIISFYKYMPPKLKEQFITELKFLLSENEWNSLNERYKSEDVLSTEELFQLSKDPLVHIGSHGHNHHIISTLTEEEILMELNLSSMVLNSITGNFPKSYCYPNGKLKDTPDNIEKLLEKSNYYYAFTTIHRKTLGHIDYYRIPRFPISYSYTPKLISKILF